LYDDEVSDESPVGYACVNEGVQRMFGALSGG
jgi:hypothetical protein